MKCLTVRQPWTYSIAALGKPIENRTWTTSYRGSLAIHAGAAWDEDGAMDDRIIETLRKDVRYVFSAIVAVVELVDVCTIRGAVEECGCGLWAVPGQCHWQLAHVRQLTEPVRCRGQQGLWDLTPADADGPSELERAVQAQIGANA